MASRSRLTKEFVSDATTMVRCAGIRQAGDEALPLTAETYAAGVQWAFRAACEVEQPLRELRDEVLRRQQREAA